MYSKIVASELDSYYQSRETSRCFVTIVMHNLKLMTPLLNGHALISFPVLTIFYGDDDSHYPRSRTWRMQRSQWRNARLFGSVPSVRCSRIIFV